MYGYIYKTTNLINNKIYIGQHKSVCFDTVYYGSGKILLKAINKYGKENFKCELIEECSNYDEMNKKEMYWISYYNSTNSKIGYNVKLGGDQSPCVDYVKKKISNTLKNHPVSEESRKKMSEKTKENAIKYKGTFGMTGKKQSDLCKETNRKVHLGKSPGNKGKHPSEEIRQKLRKSHLGQVAWNKGIPMKKESKEKMLKTKGKVYWINKNFENKICKQAELNKYLNEGWKIGRSFVLYHYSLNKELINVYNNLKEANEKTGFPIHKIKQNYSKKEYFKLNCIFSKEKLN